MGTLSFSVLCGLFEIKISNLVVDNIEKVNKYLETHFISNQEDQSLTEQAKMKLARGLASCKFEA